MLCHALAYRRQECGEVPAGRYRRPGTSELPPPPGNYQAPLAVRAARVVPGDQDAVCQAPAPRQPVERGMPDGIISCARGRPPCSLGTLEVLVSESTPCTAPQVRAWKIGCVMETSGLDVMHILEIRIVGTEKEIFKSPKRGWLNTLGVISTGFRDWSKPGCARALRDVLRHAAPKEAAR